MTTGLVVIIVLMGVVVCFNASKSFSHSLHNASIDGNTRFAPAWVSTSSFSESVLVS